MSDVNVGVRQGIVMSPLIFFIFINDFSFYICEGTILLYMESTCYVVSSDNKFDILQKIVTILSKFK